MSMGLHGNEKIWDLHKLSPSSAGALFTSPLNTPDRAVDPQHCSTSTRGDYARLGLVQLPSRWNATIFMLAFRCANTTCFFNIFRLFNFSILLTDGIPSINIDIIFRYPITCRRSPWTIQCTGGTIHKWFI